MFTIQTLDKISAKGLELFPRDQYEIATEISNPDAIILRSTKIHDMELPPKLKAIARAGAGVNNIPIDKCTKKGIVVFNTPGANANAVKELVLAALLLASRKIHDGISWAQSLKGNGDQVPVLVEKGKSQFKGPEIKGKTLGVIGLGAIGVMVANDALALGMNVIGYDPFISINSAWELSSNVAKASSLDHLLSVSDYITIHVPFNENTNGMINKNTLKIMKKGVRILNFARGGLVDNKDILEAIENGKVACYVTDFPEEELLGNERIIAIPHLGASTPESEENCALMAASQLREFLEKGNVRNSVNYANCELPFSGDTRIISAHDNIPNMLGQITTILAQNNYNIADMISKNKDKTGYTIVDVNGKVSPDIIEKIKAVSGINMVNVIDISNGKNSD
ncbi:3-phosphoglycerate dehydrogenase family protein [Acetivibrio saccincola]|uniref:D-3-phosphoglycerate dehydrogenase n=1 Tax=Acetivibrio saccincola TaxID=1677857 RepID=A0A2S8R9R5_9FIRM|nr:3-phosphoglycerate dehydrogenase family protein [Acetivibrio saccincola]PQQ66541.1 3-phosphoglycerate dehydrogenase [Acetivibrio saccincola]